MGFFSSCDKAEEQYQQTNLKREYKLDDKLLTLTYNINKEGRVAVVEKTADNLAIYDYFKNNPNTFVNYNMQTGKGEIYESVEKFQASCKPLTASQIEEINKLKAAKLGINFYAYLHPNYNTQAYSTGINHLSSYSGWNHTELSTRYINSGVAESDKKGFAISSLPGASNQISSIQVIQNTSSTSHTRNFFQVLLYDYSNFNYTGSFLNKSGYSTGFYTNGTTAQNGCDDLRKWVMSTFLFWSESWNDDIESMSGYYRN